MDVGPARQPRSLLAFRVGAEPHFPRLERFPTFSSPGIDDNSEWLHSTTVPGTVLSASCSLCVPEPKGPLTPRRARPSCATRGRHTIP